MISCSPFKRNLCFDEFLQSTTGASNFLLARSPLRPHSVHIFRVGINQITNIFVESSLYKFLCGHVRHAMLKPVLVHHKHFCRSNERPNKCCVCSAMCAKRLYHFCFFCSTLRASIDLRYRHKTQVALALPASWIFLQILSKRRVFHFILFYGTRLITVFQSKKFYEFGTSVSVFPCPCITFVKTKIAVCFLKTVSVSHRPRKRFKMMTSQSISSRFCE